MKPRVLYVLYASLFAPEELAQVIAQFVLVFRKLRALLAFIQIQIVKSRD